MNGYQLQGPTCAHGYSALRGFHPNGRPCDDWNDVGSFTVTPVQPATGPRRNLHHDHAHLQFGDGPIGRYHDLSEPGVRTGRTYGADEGERLARLASRAVLVFSLVMLAFIVLTALWVLFGGDAVPPASVVPSAPPVSPGHVVGNGPYFG